VPVDIVHRNVAPPMLRKHAAVHVARCTNAGGWVMPAPRTPPPLSLVDKGNKTQARGTSLCRHTGAEVLGDVSLPDVVADVAPARVADVAQRTPDVSVDRSQIHQ
jgi:hypothetical protein